jgi:hypothetical protein
MNGWLVVGFLGLALTGVGCNAPTCGPGTKQVQQPNGELKCLPVDAPASSITCDADAGVHIFAGACVSTITCGDNTRLDPDTGQCVGTGTGMMTAHVPAACPTPSGTSVCINGVVRHLVDNSFLASGEKVRVAVYAPLSFLADPTIKPIAEIETDDTYTFKSISMASLGGLPLVALGVSDPAATAASPTLQITGSGGQVVAGGTYTIDTYATPKSLVAAWTAASNGIDYDAKGAFVMKFYSDAAEPPTNLVATETMPVAGVMLVEGLAGVTPPTARYFSTTLMTIDPALTATTTVGAGILPAGAMTPDSFTGSGGGVAKWESLPGGTAPHVVFVGRFHPSAQ